MANYYCTIRTNYFHVKDEEKFRALMDRVYGTEDDVKLFESHDENGNPVFGFGTYGAIAGVRDSKYEEDDETSYDEFLDGLQECVADDDAVIILESGNEKLRYVIGTATIITSSDYGSLDMTFLASEKAAEMLGNPNWQTRCEY